MTIAGFVIGPNNFGINNAVVNQYELGDQISWTHGEHTVRAGFDGDYYRWKWFFSSLLIGQLTFSSFPDFLLGLPGCSPVATVPACSATNPGGTPNNPATNGTSQTNCSNVQYAFEFWDDLKCIRQSPLDSVRPEVHFLSLASTKE